MSKLLKTYRVWTGCGGWVRRTTTEAVWRATPRFKGLAIALGCTGGILVGGGIARAIDALPPITDSSPRWQVVYPSPPVNMPEPESLEMLLPAVAALILWRRGK